MPDTTSSRVFSRQSPPNNPVKGGFAPSASPPLILAFLAIGLFALSMIGVFGWRRVQSARLRGLRGEMHRHEWTAEERSSARTPMLGPRPKLYDLWTIGAKYVDKSNEQFANDSDATAEHETWDTIMPVSAVVTQSCPTKNDGTLSQASESAPAAPFYRWTRRIEAEKGVFRGKVKGNNVNDEREIQVAVAIAMPTRPIPHDITRSTGIGRGSIGEARGDDTFVYTLGVYECAWGHDNG
ncbi:hypothetical protein C0993_003123 [Termitomyces sp. T159_Od127]|nr:hypothetical protein C0993_003123 [Termitomyces sp. T159_Od127]